MRSVVSSSVIKMVTKINLRKGAASSPYWKRVSSSLQKAVCSHRSPAIDSSCPPLSYLIVRNVVFKYRVEWTNQTIHPWIFFEGLVEGQRSKEQDRLNWQVISMICSHARVVTYRHQNMAPRMLARWCWFKHFKQHRLEDSPDSCSRPHPQWKHQRQLSLYLSQ